MLQAFLVRDAVEPRGETGVVAQAADVAHGGGERLLHHVQRGGAIAEELGGVGVERRLMPLEEDVPGVGVMAASGGEELGVR